MNALDNAIGAKLIGDTGAGGVNNATTGATGGIYQFGPEEGAGFPRVHFQETANLPDYTFQTLSSNEVYYQYTAFAVTGNEAGAITAGRLADRIATLFTDPVLVATGKTVLYCRFWRSIPGDRHWDEVAKRHVYQKGGYLKLWVA